MKLLPILLVLELVHSSLGALPVLHHVHEKFEFKYSFKGPYIVNSKGQIPFWNYGGSAIPSDESVRVCPSIKSRMGWVWTKEPFNHKHWMVDVVVRVTGRLKTGADGMAIWFTDRQLGEGQVFGAQDTWRGVGIFLDSFDNDGLNDNPKMQVVLNDGTRRYEHYSDGLRNEIGSCLKEFRNRPYPVKIRLYFLRGTFELWVHDGISLVEDDYKQCAKIEDKIELGWIPQEGYFGVTAATGGLSDDHDVTKFITHSLVPYEEKTDEILKMINEQEAEEVEQEYHKKAEAFDRRRDEYLDKKPGGRKDASFDWQREMEIEQNMRLVADMLMQLQQEIGRVERKLDTIINMGMGGDPRGLQQQPGGMIASDVAQLKTTSSQMLHQLADIRASIDRSAPEGAKVATSEHMQPLYETKNTVLQNTKQLQAIETHLRDLSQHRCPTEETNQSACLSPWLFLVAMVTQLVVILGYMIYRSAQERNAKKFF